MILGPTKIIVNFILGFGIGQLFGYNLLESAFLGFLIMMSSTAIIGKYLMDTGEMQTLTASISITMLLIEDFVAVILLAILESMVGTKVGVSTVVMTSVAVVLVFMFVISEYSKYVLNFIDRFEYKKHVALYALGIMFFLTYLVSFFGLAPAIGAFFAGYLFSKMRHSEEIENELGTFRDFFSAFFFVSVGMMFTIPAGISVYFVILSLLIVSVFASYFVYGVIGKYFGLEGDMPAKLSGLMIPIGEFSLIIASYAVQLKLPHALDILNSAIMLGILTAILMPYAMRSVSWYSRILDRIPANSRLSLTGSIVHASKGNKEIEDTIVSFIRSIGIYLLAGFSVIYLLILASTRVHAYILGYSLRRLTPWIAATLLVPVLYGIVVKVRWLGRTIVGIAGPTMFPDLKDYHIRWMQYYLADLLAGFTLILIGAGVMLATWLAAPDYIIFPVLVMILGIIYTIKGYLVSMENYGEIKKGIRTKKRMRMVGGRLSR